MDAALTPPIAATASPDSATARPAGRPRTAPTSGRIAQGTTSPGKAAAEVDPITMVNVGHRTKIVAASSREPSVPIPSARAILTCPANPTVISSASQSRSISQTGTCASWPRRKNGAIGMA